MQAANLAGKAINISKTTACHAVSYPITSHFGVPHGHAVTLTLGKMFVYNSHVSDQDCLDSRGVNYVCKVMEDLCKMLGVDSSDKAEKKIHDLMDRIGLKKSLGELGINNKGLEIILNEGFNPERVKNNPRRLTRDKLRKMLQEIR